MSEYVSDLNDRISVLTTNAKSARSRLSLIFDEGSFAEIGAFVTQRSTDFLSEKLDTPADGVVCGYGRIDGRLVYAYSQDNSVLGGSIGEMHAKKIEMTYSNALKMGAPVIGLIDSKGVRLNENVDALNAFGTVFAAMSNASGVVPQISVILGECVGGMSFIPALSDFVFMTETDSFLFMSSPNSIPGSEGRNTSFDKYGGGKTHSEKSGIVHFVKPTENEIFASLKELISYLPSNNMEESVVLPTEESLIRKCPELDSMCDGDEIDVMKIISCVSDGNRFLEVSKDFGATFVTGFLRINGFTAGVLANKGNDALICAQGIAKAVPFINFCDSFNIPIISFTNVKGFYPSDLNCQAEIIKGGSSLLHAFCAATVPKINVIVGDACGSAYIIMNSKHVGADIVFAWPNAKISVMDATAAVNIMLAEELKSADNSIEYRDQKIAEYNNMQSSPYTAASRGYIDAVIVPSETRDTLSNSLEALFSKRVLAPSRKHSSFA